MKTIYICNQTRLFTCLVLKIDFVLRARYTVIGIQVILTMRVVMSTQSSPAVSDATKKKGNFNDNSNFTRKLWSKASKEIAKTNTV